MLRAVWTLLFIGLAFGSLDPWNVSKYEHSQQLNEKYSLYWTIDTRNLYMAVEVQTLGWIGFGLGEPTSGSMPGSDIVTVAVNGKDGSIPIKDRYTEKYALPLEDDCQDWQVKGGDKNGTHTVVHLYRELNTGDLQDRVITPGLTRVIWAFDAEDNIEPQYHRSNRGATIVEFIPSLIPIPPLPKDAVRVSLVMPNVTIPPNETNYLCGAFVLPVSADHDSHIIRIDPVIDPATSFLTHHMFVAICDTNFTGSYWDYYRNHPGESCLNLPPIQLQPNDRCNEYLFGWGKGTGPLILPEPAGFRMGKGKIEYLIVQMHYTNPDHLVGYKDHSGIDVWYTNTLRPNDVGMILLGDVWNRHAALPAGDPALEVEITCPKECTERFAEDIHVFASYEHMHQVGRKIWTTHWNADRSNHSILNHIDYYSYGFQQITPIDVVIHPGDSLNTHCIYDTSKRTEPTPFGQGSYDEMCLDLIWFYPKLTHESFCGYVTPDISICGDATQPTDIMMLPNPNLPDPKNLKVDTFGEPCVKPTGFFSSSYEETSPSPQAWYLKKTTYVLLAIGGGVFGILGVICIVGLLVAFSKFQARQRRTEAGRTYDMLLEEL